MSVSWLVLVMAAAVLVSMVLLVVVCLNCRTNGPLVSIRQTNVSEESSVFRVIHPSQPISDRNSIHPAHLLSPFSDPGTQRHSAFPSTETDSNPSYENPGVVESDNDDPGYIIVLPEGATPVTNQSRASTPSSDVLHDYENVPEKKSDGADSRGEYLNVENFHSDAWSPSLSRPTFEPSAQSKSSDDEDDEDDDDDGDSDSEGNYVNVNEAPL